MKKYTFTFGIDSHLYEEIREIKKEDKFLFAPLAKLINYLLELGLDAYKKEKALNSKKQ